MTVDTFAALSPGLRQFFEELLTRGFMGMRAFSPELLEVLRLDPSTPPGVLREQVHRRLVTAAEQVDKNLSTIFLTAAGFRRDAPPGVAARLQAAAAPLQISERTARRRYQRACARIAAILVSSETRSALADIDYVYLASRTWIDLRDDEPAIVISRTLSARTDRIDHIEDRFRLPRFTGDQLTVISLEGCRLERSTLVGDRIWALTLGFPHVLRLGDQHTFAISIRLPDRDSLDPFVGFLPHTTSLDATVELLFGERRPAVLEKFSTPPPVDGLTRIPGAETIRPVEDRHLFVFEQMKPGLCFGIRWHWEDPYVPVS